MLSSYSTSLLLILSPKLFSHVILVLQLIVEEVDNNVIIGMYVIVISQAGVGYHCYYRRLRSSVNNNDILRVLVI